MAAYTANQVSINNGQKNVVVNSNESPEGVSQGDFICIGTFTPMEISRTYVDGAGKHVIELLKAWGNSNQSNQPAIVIPTTVQFKDTVKALQTANRLLNDNTQAMQDWQTKTGSVTFIDAAGVSQTVKTLKQMQIENDALHPFPWAMRKVAFEANRKQNNEMFAASGFVSLGKSTSQKELRINEGLYVIGSPGFQGELFLGRELQNFGESPSDSAVINIAGVLTDVTPRNGRQRTSYELCTIYFPPVEDGTRTYDSATGVSVVHATPAIAFSSETKTNKVVTDRVDMWGFEAYLREISDTDPFVYPHGLIQSLATEISGVTTVSDNVRPTSYFAWYDGDTGSRGKGVNWQTASEANRIKIASDPAHNIYFDDATSKFYQWCVRGRSFAGLGNGDWESVLTHKGVMPLSFSTLGSTREQPHGGLDAPPARVWNNGYQTMQGTLRYGGPKGQGDYRIGSNVLANVVSGECYFLVCGTVSRLNKGAYHTGFNASGTFLRGRNDGSGNGEFWHSTRAYPILSMADCFDSSKNATKASEHGGIGGVSGRPDGRLYDAIYTSGLGGAIDLRLPAWDASSKKIASEVKAKVTNSEYRGAEKLTQMLPVVVYDSNPANPSVGGFSVDGTALGAIKKPVDEVIYRLIELGAIDYNLSVNAREVGIATEEENLQVYWYVSGIVVLKTSASIGSKAYIPVDSNLSISGDFLQTDVIGMPEKILLTAALKDGWVGRWISKTPSSGGKNYPLTRKQLASTSSPGYSAIATTDNGANWAGTHGGNQGWSSILNSNNVTLGLNTIQIMYYYAFAKQTKPSENFPILHGEQGVGSVFVGCSHYPTNGNVLCESLIGKIITNTVFNYSVGSYAVTYFPLDTENRLSQAVSYGRPTHNPLRLGPPNNSSVAFKVLVSQIARDNQASLGFLANGLTYSSSWGDDGSIKVSDGVGRYTDDNGSHNIMTSHELALPYGWIKNDK